MAKLVARVRNLWKRPEPPRVLGLPFSVPCCCGQLVTGERKPAFQVVPCPACRTELFVLPLSPLPDPGSESGRRRVTEPLPPTTPAVKPRRIWPILLASMAVLSVSVAGVVISLGYLFPPDNTSPETTSPEEVQTHMSFHQRKAAGFIAEGHFCQALEQLDAVADWQHRLEDASRGHLLLDQQRREIALYADLLEEPLEEILDHAVGLPGEEWQAQFRKRYQGKAVIFDTELRREGPERIRSAYQIQAQGESAQLHCEDLPILRELPLDAPRRVLFGARLARIKRTAPTIWEVRFAPDSGVLLTNAQAAAVSCPALGTASVGEILRWQEERVRAAAEQPSS